MITSIFSKSKPINFIIVIALVVVGFLFHIFFGRSTESYLSWNTFLSLFLVIFYVFLTDFIVSKNGLTRRNSYSILILGLLVFIFPEVYSNFNLLVANLLILFATRRLLSLHTNKSLHKKFFDAGFWIAVATLFYSWAILFFILLFIAFVYYWQSEAKYFFIIILSIATVFILLVLFNIVIKDQFLPDSNFSFSYSLEFTKYNRLGNILRFTIVFALYFWSCIHVLNAASEKNKKLKPVRNLVLVFSVLALTVALLSPVKLGSEIVFFIFPFAVIAGNYLQKIDETWFREVIVFLLIGGGVANLVL